MAAKRKRRTGGDRARPVVGVLAIQGDVEKHLAALERCGASGRRVLVPADLVGLSALVLPGGESTTISKGLDRHGLVEPIRAFAKAGGAVLGTCAGAILLARSSRNHPVPTLGLLDVEALRNAYGTQVDSFVAPADASSRPAWRGMECVFIRAPRLVDPGRGVEVLATVDSEPVLVRQGRRLACTFHPELTDDVRVHAALLELAKAGPIGGMDG
ncbi:MAG: pyridoxal 5'-phosphate synthase glutaminase subunit PdxT [Deltaproteobacteria bacterium]|nr:pyridoxal 5'-phosphate synthase glutaminase subunit PdxT [Deltaproteobacteria bacterium]